MSYSFQSIEYKYLASSSSYLKLSGFPKPGWLFPSSYYGSFQPLLFQMIFLTLYLSLLLWNPYNVNNMLLDVVIQLCKGIFTSFNSFFTLLLCLGEFHCFVFQLTDFSSTSSTLLLNPSTVFFSPFITFVWYFLYFLSPSWISMFIHPSSKISELFNDHYFELFFKQVVYLCFIKIFF